MIERVLYIPDSKSDNLILDDIMGALTEKGIKLTVVSNEDVKSNDSAVAECVRLDKLEFEKLTNCLVFSDVCNLSVLLPIAKSIKGSRIYLYAGRTDSLTDLFRCCKVTPKDRDAFAELISKHLDSIAFLNGESQRRFFRALSYEERGSPSFIPILRTEKKTIETHTDIVDEKEINIGWIGPIFDITKDRILDICKDLVGCNIDKRITIHMIGQGEGSADIKFLKYAPNVRFAYVGNLPEPERSEYITNSVDLLIAYRGLAMECCELGVPVYVIPPFGDYDGKFSLISDIVDYDFSSKYDMNSKKPVTLSNIINDIYVNGRKAQLADACRMYGISNMLHGEWTDRIVIMLEGATLTSEEFDMLPFLKKASKRATKNTRRFHYDYEKAIESLSDYNNIILSSLDKPEDLIDNVPLKLRAVARFKQIANKLLRFGSRAYGRCKEYAWKIGVKVYKKWIYTGVQRKYPSKIRRIIEKNKDKRIKVAFLIVFKTSFPMRGVFEKMLDDTDFDPYIIVAPNVSRSFHYRMQLFNDTYNCLSHDYPGKVIPAYDAKTDSFMDLKDEYPIIVFCNPYKHLVHEMHDIDYFLDKDVLGIYANYGYAAVNFWKEVINTEFYNKAWKVCIENEMNYQYLRKEEPIHGKNGIVTGYAKMDLLSKVEKKNKDRKRILICPHHTVWGWKILNISNFLKYSELFVELPKMFPEIDFIFRPHPLLFPNLKEYRLWTEEQIEDYMSRLLSSPNMTYSTVEDYSDEFIQSDAMIHDCASFTAEYLFTNNPCCYMIKTEEETIGTMLPFGKKCLTNYYHASNEEDIIQFIRDVVIGGNDWMKEQRTEFVEKELRVNYPHVAESFIEYLKKELRRGP